MAFDGLNIRGDVDRLHMGEFPQALQVTPSRKGLHGVQVGLTRMIVGQMCCEEFKKALLGFRLGDKESRQLRR
jgi:hypothetical protein